METILEGDPNTQPVSGHRSSQKDTSSQVDIVPNSEKPNHCRRK